MSENAPRAFEWDDAKAAANQAKHGVPFDYAARVFLDSARVDLDASRPADAEPRRKVIGVIDNRLLAVVYTVRRDVIRIISARRCNAKEARSHGSIDSRSE